MIPPRIPKISKLPARPTWATAWPVRASAKVAENGAEETKQRGVWPRGRPGAVAPEAPL